MQHCFHVVFYIKGTQYLHIMHPGKEKSFRTLYLTVSDFKFIINCDEHAQNSKSLFIYISAVSEVNVTQINFEIHQEKNTKNHF